MLLQRNKSLLNCSRQGGVFHLWQSGGVHVFYPLQLVKVGEKMKLRGNSAWIMHFGPNNDQELYPKLDPHGFFRTLNAYSGTYVPEESALTHQFKANSATVATFPKAFHAHVGAALGENEMTTQFSFIAQTEGTFIWPGFHPYFRTPLQVAEVTIGNEKYTIFGGHVGNRYLAGDPIITNASDIIMVNVPGVGMIRIKPQGRFLDEGTMVVLWTDSNEYLCVELVQMKPQEVKPDDQLYTVGCTIQVALDT